MPGQRRDPPALKHQLSNLFYKEERYIDEFLVAHDTDWKLLYDFYIDWFFLTRFYNFSD